MNQIIHVFDASKIIYLINLLKLVFSLISTVLIGLILLSAYSAVLIMSMMLKPNCVSIGILIVRCMWRGESVWSVVWVIISRLTTPDAIQCHQTVHSQTKTDNAWNATRVTKYKEEQVAEQ